MYNPSLYANVFMEVLSMNETLKTQLKILKLSDIVNDKINMYI